MDQNLITMYCLFEVKILFVFSGESFILSKYEPLTPNIDGVMAL